MKYLWERGLTNHITGSGGFRGAKGARAPLQPEIFSISCSFSENLAISYVGSPPPSPDGWRPLLRGILDPPMTGDSNLMFLTRFWWLSDAEMDNRYEDDLWQKFKMKIELKLDGTQTKSAE